MKEHNAGCDCGCMGMGPVMKEILRRVLPGEEAGRHFQASRTEFLKGLRALLDEQIAAAEEKPKAGARVTVE
jgi:hypothetical protein